MNEKPQSGLGWRRAAARVLRRVPTKWWFLASVVCAFVPFVQGFAFATKRYVWWPNTLWAQDPLWGTKAEQWLSERLPILLVFVFFYATFLVFQWLSQSYHDTKSAAVSLLFNGAFLALMPWLTIRPLMISNIAVYLLTTLPIVPLYLAHVSYQLGKVHLVAAKNQDKVEPYPTSTSIPAVQGRQTLFEVSGRFLHDCYDYLTQMEGPEEGQQEPEWILLVTGYRRDSTVVMGKMHKVKMEVQTRTFVRADASDQRDILIGSWALGEQLVALFHSHPWPGIDAVHPSSTDVDNHKQHEKGGYKLLTGIFSNDGYIGFWPHREDLKVVVYTEGKGIERVDKDGRIWRLRKVS